MRYILGWVPTYNFRKRDQKIAIAEEQCETFLCDRLAYKIISHNMDFTETASVAALPSDQI